MKRVLITVDVEGVIRREDKEKISQVDKMATVTWVFYTPLSESRGSAV